MQEDVGTKARRRDENEKATSNLQSINPVRIQQLYQGRVDRIAKETSRTKDGSSEDQSTPIELSGAHSASGSSARMKKIYRSRLNRAQSDEGSGEFDADIGSKNLVEDELHSRINNLYQTRWERTESAIEKSSLQSDAPGKESGDSTNQHSTAEIRMSTERMQAIYKSRAAQNNNGNGRDELNSHEFMSSSNLSLKNSNTQMNLENHDSADNDEGEMAVATSVLYPHSPVEGALPVAHLAKDVNSSEENLEMLSSDLLKKKEVLQGEEACRLHESQIQCQDAPLANVQERSGNFNACPANDGAATKLATVTSNEDAREAAVLPSSRMAVIDVESGRSEQDDIYERQETSDSRNIKTTAIQLLVTPGQSFLNPQPAPRLFLKLLQKLGLDGVELNSVEIAPSVDEGGNVQFMVGCHVSPGMTAKAIARSLMQRVDTKSLEWAEAMNSSSRSVSKGSVNETVDDTRSNMTSGQRPSSADASRNRTPSIATSCRGRTLKGLEQVRPSWPNPGSKHPGHATEWDAPSPRTPIHGSKNLNSGFGMGGRTRPSSAGASAGRRKRTVDNSASKQRIRPISQRPQSASSSSRNRIQRDFGNSEQLHGTRAVQQTAAPSEVVGLRVGEYPETLQRRPQSANDALKHRPSWNSRFHLDIKAEQGLRFATRNGETNQVRPSFNVAMMRNRIAPSRVEVALNIANDLSPSWRKHVLTERCIAGTGRVRISEMLATQPYDDDRDAMPCSRGFLVEKIVTHKTTGTTRHRLFADASELLDSDHESQTTVVSFHMPVSHLRAVAKLLEDHKLLDDRSCSRALGRDRITCCKSKDGFELSPPLYQVLPRMDLEAVLKAVLMATENESLRTIMNESTASAKSNTVPATPRSSSTSRGPTRPSSATPSSTHRRQKMRSGMKLSSTKGTPKSAIALRKAKEARAKKSRSVRDAEHIYRLPYPGHDLVNALF